MVGGWRSILKHAPRWSPRAFRGRAAALNPTGFWGYSGLSKSGQAGDEPFLSWLAQVANTTDADVPLVFSTSYGEDEDREVQPQLLPHSWPDLFFNHQV